MKFEIWKFQVSLATVNAAGIIAVDMPDMAQVLTVRLQRGVPTVWVAVNPEEPKVTRQFRWVMTGEEFDGKGVYVGTVQFDAGHNEEIVSHLFVL